MYKTGNMKPVESIFRKKERENEGIMKTANKFDDGDSIGTLNALESKTSRIEFTWQEHV